MAEEEVALRLSLKDRALVARGLKGTADDLEGVSKSTDKVERSARKSGSVLSRLSKFGLGALKKTAIGATAAVAGVASSALWKGFGRLKAIDQAQASLRGLKLTGTEIKSVMGSATDAVTGTAYGLDAAAGAAAGALGAGVRQGKELTSYLSLIGDATAQSTTDFSSMARMLNKVEGAGKLTGEVLNQMAENGLQVMPMLTKEYGKNSAEIQKMVSKGQVSADDFRRILTKNIGGAAMQSGKTFSGALANMNAALGRLGAKILGPVFTKMPGLFSRLGGGLDSIGPTAERLGTRIGSTFAQIGKRLSQVNWSAAGEALRTTFGRVRVIVGDLAATFGPLLKDLTAGAIKAAPGIFERIGSALSTVGSVVSSVTGFMRNHQTTVQALAVAVGAGVVAWKLWTGAIKTWQAIVKGAIAIQAAWNAVLALNPIMLIVIGLAALAAALVYAYKKSETFRNIVNGAFNIVRRAIARVIDTVAGLMGIFAKMLRALSKAPGFGWAGRAADAMDRAARKARGVADEVRGIPKNPKVTITVGAAYTDAALKAMNRRARQEAEGRETGGPVRKGQPYIVGEKRPELFVPRTDGMILPRVPEPDAMPTPSGGGAASKLPPLIIKLVTPSERQFAEMVIDELDDLAALT